jgi:2-methylisocitrate lyase-like PEP mutase family enzyme
LADANNSRIRRGVGPRPTPAKALGRIGIARITVASAPTLITMSGIQKLAAELRSTGSFDMLSPTLRHGDAQRLFQSKG